MRGHQRVRYPMLPPKLSKHDLYGHCPHCYYQVRAIGRAKIVVPRTLHPEEQAGRRGLQEGQRLACAEEDHLEEEKEEKEEEGQEKEVR